MSESAGAVNWTLGLLVSARAADEESPLSLLEHASFIPKITKSETQTIALFEIATFE